MGMFDWIGRLAATAPGAAKLSLLGSGIGLAGTLLSTFIGMRHDKKMWKMANAYNSPEAQVARLKKAGLNPMLAYGSGNVVGNTQQQRPMTVIPDLSSVVPNFTGVIAKSQETAYKAELEKLAEENRKLVKEKIATEWANQGYTARKEQGQDISNRIATSLAGYNKTIKKLQAEEIFPKLVKKYGLQNADLAWKLSEYNPALLEKVFTDTALQESKEGLNRQTFDAIESLGGYDQGTVSRFLTTLLQLLMRK